MLTLRSRLLGRLSPRLLFAATLCALILNGVAYLAHRHSNDECRGDLTQTQLCGLCTTYGSLGSAPVVAVSAQRVLLLLRGVLAPAIAAPVLRRFVTSARPRAPPIS